MANKAFFANVPSDERNRILRGIRYDAAERQQVFDKFVLKFLKINSEESENFNRTVVHLEKNPDKKISKPKHDQTTKKLSYRQKKKLGLFNLGRKSLEYKNLLSLHRLWVDYMIKYLKLDELEQQGWSNSPDDPNFDQVSVKLYRADFHGCKLMVLKSSCPSYVGLKGIVAMETKNCFKLLGQDNIVRTIPKAICMFQFNIFDFEFTFLGRNLQVRPAERSSRKIKTVHFSDLQL